MISISDYLYFADDALEAMSGIVSGLGDELANCRPDLPGGNSPYALLTHCLGVMEYWGGHVVAGRSIERDRAAEFRASGRVDELVERARAVRERFVADVQGAEPFNAPRRAPGRGDVDLPLGRTQGGALFHVYEELAQHRGQMEVCRDVLLGSRAGR